MVLLKWSIELTQSWTALIPKGCFILLTTSHTVACYHTSAASVTQRCHLYCQYQAHMTAYSSVKVQVSLTFMDSVSPYDPVLRRQEYKPSLMLHHLVKA